MNTINPVIPASQMNIELPAGMPAIPQATTAPTEVLAPESKVTAGCVMPFAIEEITRLEIQFPWGFLAEEFDVAYIDHEGNLTVTSDAPQLNQTLGRFELVAGTRYVVLGKVAQNYVQHWQKSVTFRPEAEVAEEEATSEPVQEPVVEPVKQPDVIVDTIDWGAASNTKKKKQARLLASRGTLKHEAHAALQAYWPE